MSQEQKPSFALDPLEADTLQIIVEKFSSLKVNADEANKKLLKVQNLYLRRMALLAEPLSIKSEEYRPNFLTLQLEPIPPAPTPPPPRVAPDSEAPPAPPKLEPDPIP